MSAQSLRKPPYMLLLKIDFLRTLNIHIFGLGGSVFIIITFLKSSLNRVFIKIVRFSLHLLLNFGATLMTSFSRENVTKWKNKNDRNLGNPVNYLVSKNGVAWSKNQKVYERFSVFYGHHV